MTFSILIPTCNRSELLGKCLDRLVTGEQSLPSSSFEVIVSDDSDTSETAEFCRIYYPWVGYTRGHRKGPAANRNNAASLSKGDWLVFVDDDCIPDASLLQAYGTYIQSNSGVLVMEGTILPEGPKPDARSFAPIKQIGGSLWSCNFCIYRELFEQIGGFDDRFRHPHMEDKDLQTRIELHGIPIQFVKNAKVIHPWRKMASGKVLALREEAYIYYCAKHQVSFNVFTYAKKLFLFYATRIFAPFHFRDAIYLMAQYFIHLSCFLWHFPKWRRQYNSTSRVQ